MKRSTSKPKALPFTKISGIQDDFLNRKELNLSEDGFFRAVETASIGNIQGKTIAETRSMHGFMDKLDQCKKDLVKRIIQLARRDMDGMQLQAFLLTFQMGINKCQTSRMYKVSRQCIQIQNRRAVKKLRRLIYQDSKTRELIGEMQRLRRRIQDFD